MATLLSAIETNVRRDLKEASANFWSSAELVNIMNDGIQNMWGAIIDLFEEHYFTVSETVTLDANSSTLSTLPADLFRIYLIEPLNTQSTGTAASTKFTPKDFKSREFTLARAMTTQTLGSGLEIFFQMTGAGYPVDTPSVRVAPQISSQLALRFAYIPGIATKTASDANPIPGQADKAIHAYTMAFALAKEQEDKMPHPGWLQIYATEKDAVLQRLTPRQEQEEKVVEDLFGAAYDMD